MAIDRKPVEDFFEETERKFEEAVGPVKNKILEILSEDPEKLYSLKELEEKMGLAESCCTGEEKEEGCQGCSQCPDYFEPALKALLSEEKIVAYIWPYPPRPQESQYYFGIKK